MYRNFQWRRSAQSEGIYEAGNRLHNSDWILYGLLMSSPQLCLGRDCSRAGVMIKVQETDSTLEKEDAVNKFLKSKTNKVNGNEQD
jgi:hypothetical protein